MSEYKNVKVHDLSSWQLRYALVRYVANLEVGLTPSLRFMNGEPFSIYEMSDRPSLSFPSGEEIPGKRTKQMEPRPLRPAEIRAILDQYEMIVEDHDFGYTINIDGFEPFTSIELNEAKGRAIVALVTGLLEVAIPKI